MDQLGLFDDGRRPAGRRPLDFYPTPAGAAVLATLLDRVEISGRVLEPCAGAGDLADPLAAHGIAVVTNDVDRRRVVDYHGDAADAGAACWRGGYDWIVTNPPFRRAAPILATSYDQARIGVAFLLRLTFLEPAAGRGAWLVEHAPHLSDLIILNPRPSFTADNKTDSVTVAWFVWRRAWSGATRVAFATNWRP